ncbi:MAG: 2-dehydro-3-deoxyphosphogluconate aldolase [Alphaproteobacteria bacterium]|nr:MAG: 2-dehydro-3-deoxyphosphogluconate aldolase [Alphaproteobacteria bacterium]
MTVHITSLLEATPIVPLIQTNDPVVAVKIARALAAGGLEVVEVVLRTPAALECLRAIAVEVDEVISGAGTVLSAAQAEAVVEAGAKFIVSPGLDEGVVSVARAANLPIYAGISTATEVQRAHNMGLKVVKFFPASLAGGIPMLKALSSVFGDMRFMPTGGVSAANLSDFLALPSVLACGGSWITPADAIAAGDFEAVTKLAREAANIAQTARSKK